MFTTASQILEEFIKREELELSKINMPHMPTLGTGYEQITKNGIGSGYSIPNNLELSVVSGFISIDGEMQSQQIDCMLVHGKGTKYGLTNEYIYPIENILVIFEVKKHYQSMILVMLLAI